MIEAPFVLVIANLIYVIILELNSLRDVIQFSDLIKHFHEKRLIQVLAKFKFKEVKRILLKKIFKLIAQELSSILSRQKL